MIQIVLHLVSEARESQYWSQDTGSTSNNQEHELTEEILWE